MRHQGFITSLKLSNPHASYELFYARWDSVAFDTIYVLSMYRCFRFYQNLAFFLIVIFLKVNVFPLNLMLNGFYMGLSYFMTMICGDQYESLLKMPIYTIVFLWMTSYGLCGFIF